MRTIYKPPFRSFYETCLLKISPSHPVPRLRVKSTGQTRALEGGHLESVESTMSRSLSVVESFGAEAFFMRDYRMRLLNRGIRTIAAFTQTRPRCRKHALLQPLELIQGALPCILL